MLLSNDVGLIWDQQTTGEAEGVCLCLFAQDPEISNVPAAPSSGGTMNIVGKKRPPLQHHRPPLDDSEMLGLKSLMWSVQTLYLQSVETNTDRKKCIILN